MKLLFLLTIFTSLSLQAIEVKEARYNYNTNRIEVLIFYSGGCAKHDFKLKLNPACLESLPVQCSAKIIDEGDPDPCEAHLPEQLDYSLAEVGLNDAYYSEALLSIAGDIGKQISIQLPPMDQNGTPVTKLSDESISLARVLLNPQVKKCIEQEMPKLAELSVIGGTKKIIPNGVEYKLEAVSLVGGDVATGYHTLVITETNTTNILGMPTTTYQCKLTR